LPAARRLNLIRLYFIVLVLSFSLAGLSACEFSNSVRWMSISVTPTASQTPTFTQTATATDTPASTRTATADATETYIPTETSTATPAPDNAEAAQESDGCSGADSAMESAVLNLINAQRAGNGVAAVQSSSSLAAIARNYSQTMAENGFFDHGNVGGRVNPSNQYAAVGEIIYAGPGPYNSAEQAVATWLNSPVHRERMLDPVYTVAGVGYWCDSSSEYQGYFTVDFARP
jgi:uncharacterized protein YkwD